MLIRFVFRPITSAKNQGVLYIRIIINGERAKSDFSSFITIDEKKWDSKAQKIIPLTSPLNRELDLLKENLWTNYHDLKVKNPTVTAEMVKQHYLKGSQKTTIIEVSEKCLEESKRLSKSYSIYLHLHNSLVKFLQTTKKKYLDDIDFVFADEFVCFIKTYYPHAKGGTSSIYWLKRIVIFAQKKEWITKNPLAFYKVKKLPRDLVYLEKEHLEILERLPKINSQQKHFEFFKFQLNTGMSYCDAFRAMSEGVKIMQKNDIDFFVMKRQKTNEEFVVLVNEEIKKYLFSGTTPPKYHTYRHALHELGTKANLPFSLTSHVGRKTFAMRKRNEEGFSSAAVALMLGHDESMTEKIYSKVNLERILREVR
jgi:integrase